MLKTDHTVGPWEQFAPAIDGVVDQEYRSIRAGSGCLKYDGSFELTGFIREPDARLLAAAPSLLAACLQTLDYLQYRSDSDANGLWSRVRDAITEAIDVSFEGQQQNESGR